MLRNAGFFNEVALDVVGRDGRLLPVLGKRGRETVSDGTVLFGTNEILTRLTVAATNGSFLVPGPRPTTPTRPTGA